MYIRQKDKIKSLLNSILLTDNSEIYQWLLSSDVNIINYNYTLVKAIYTKLLVIPYLKRFALKFRIYKIV